MRRCKARFILLVGAAMLAAGCATTTDRTVGYVDPIYEWRSFDSFIVYAAFKDMALETLYEQSICVELQRAGKKCIAMLAAAPPTQPPSAERRHRATDRSGAVATVVIQLAPHADSAAVDKIGDPGPRFRITVFDNRTDDIVARFATVLKPRGKREAAVLGQALAEAIVRALQRKGLV